MVLDIDMMLRILDVCEADYEEKPLISLVFPKSGGGSGQVFLEWKQGKSLKDYIRDPILTGVLTLYQASYSRIVDHRSVKRRLTYMPSPGDEIRFIRAAPTGEM